MSDVLGRNAQTNRPIQAANVRFAVLTTTEINGMAAIVIVVKPRDATVATIDQLVE